MTVARTIGNTTETMKGRITEDLGLATRIRRCNAEAGSTGSPGSLKQAVEKTKSALGRNGSSTR